MLILRGEDIDKKFKKLMLNVGELDYLGGKLLPPTLEGDIIRLILSRYFYSSIFTGV